MNAADVGKAIGLIQLAQMITSLSAALVTAIQQGKDSVTADELAQSFENKDAGLEELAASIARAKAEGR